MIFARCSTEENSYRHRLRKEIYKRTTRMQQLLSTNHLAPCDKATRIDEEIQITLTLAAALKSIPACHSNMPTSSMVRVVILLPREQMRARRYLVHLLTSM